MAPSAKSEASVSTIACCIVSKCFRTGAVQNARLSASSAGSVDLVDFHSLAGCAVELERGNAILEYPWINRQ